MYYVGLCPVCSNGLRGVRVCCGSAVVLCDECDAVWSSPSIDVRLPADAEPSCPHCGESLWGEQAHWATKPEVEHAGWWSHIDGEAGERTSAGGPRVPDEISRLLEDDRVAGVDQREPPDSERPLTVGSLESTTVTRRGPSGGQLVIILGLLVAGCAVAALALL